MKGNNAVERKHYEEIHRYRLLHDRRITTGRGQIGTWAQNTSNTTESMGMKRHNVQESKIINRLDIARACQSALAKLKAIVENPNFHDDLRLQKDATKVVRGMALKMRSIKIAEAAELGELDKMLERVLSMAGDYEGLFREQLIKLETQGNLTLNVVNYANAISQADQQ